MTVFLYTIVEFFSVALLIAAGKLKKNNNI